jgi:two-component system response regulator RegA
MGEMILLADDDVAHVRRLARAFRSRRREIEAVDSAQRLLSRAASRSWDAIVFEPNLPGRLWYALLHELCAVRGDAYLAIVTAFPSTALRLESVALGIQTTLSKPVDPASVVDLVVRKDTSQGSWVNSPPVTLAHLEWEHINLAIRDVRGNVAAAARRLGLPRQTVYRKLRKQPAATDRPEGL